MTRSRNPIPTAAGIPLAEQTVAQLQRYLRWAINEADYHGRRSWMARHCREIANAILAELDRRDCR